MEQNKPNELGDYACQGVYSRFICLLLARRTATKMDSPNPAVMPELDLEKLEAKVYIGG